MLAVIRAMLRAGLGLALGALLLFLLATSPAEWSVRAAPALAAMAHFPGLLEADPMVASLRLLGLGMLLGVPLAALLLRLPWLAPGRGLGFGDGLRFGDDFRLACHRGCRVGHLHRAVVVDR